MPPISEPPFASVGPVVVFLHLLAACIWVGGIVSVVVSVRIARAQLDGRQQIDFFRTLGRVHGIVGGGALIVALGTGLSMLIDHGWTTTAKLAALAGAMVLAVTIVGILQARRMTRLRASAAGGSDPSTLARIERGARSALILRATLSLLTLITLALGAALAA